MTFINHQNLYYLNVIKHALENNVLALVPTGVGKTFLYTILLEYFSEFNGRNNSNRFIEFSEDNIPLFNNLYNFVKIENESNTKKINIKEFVNSSKFEDLLKQNPISRSKIKDNIFSIKLRIKLKRWIGLKLILKFTTKKAIFLVSSPTVLQNQLLALGIVSDFKIGWFTTASSDYNSTLYNNGNDNNNNNNDNNYEKKSKSLKDINSNVKQTFNNEIDFPSTFETCWDIVNFIISNYTKDALFLTPKQFKYLLDIGLLSFNTNIKLLVIDHCQIIQNKIEYLLYANIMSYYKETLEPKTIIINTEENNNDVNQKISKKRRLNTKETIHSFTTRIISIIDNPLYFDKKKEDKKIKFNINFLEEFYHCQMIWTDDNINNQVISNTIINLKSDKIKVDDHIKVDVNSKDNEKDVIMKEVEDKKEDKEENSIENEIEEDKEMDEKVKKITGKNLKGIILKDQYSKKIQDKLNALQDNNNLNSIFFSNESIINYHQCIDIDWNAYDEQVKLEQQKQKQKNSQESFFHQQFKIPVVFFKDMEKANINDRFKILLILYLKLMEFLVKKMSWLNDYKSVENTKRLIKLIKSEYKESGLWCACNVARLYVEICLYYSMS